MTIDTDTLQNLRETLRDTLQASDRFHALLAAERDALTTADMPALSELTEQKKHLTDRLLTTSRTLLDWCRDQGIEPDYRAFERWSAPIPEPDRAVLLDQWRRLRQSLNTNQRDHAANRQHLATLSARHEARLTLLKNLVGTTDTYSANGIRSSGAPSGWVDSV